MGGLFACVRSNAERMYCAWRSRCGVRVGGTDASGPRPVSDKFKRGERVYLQAIGAGDLSGRPSRGPDSVASIRSLLKSRAGERQGASQVSTIQRIRATCKACDAKKGRGTERRVPDARRAVQADGNLLQHGWRGFTDRCEVTPVCIFGS